jgi:4-hydroxybenzoate polyprenyltransferase
MVASPADPPVRRFPTVGARWKLFLGLSRTPHGILDVATPAMAALLWLGHFPPLSVVVVGLFAAFAGYTAVYALNDIVDYRIDKQRLTGTEDSAEIFHVDEIMVRHPLAQGVLSYSSGLAWCAFWAFAALETAYCLLLRVTHLKIIPSAMVKALGGLAGVYAVDPDPSLSFTALLFLWLAAWEVGGQNIANDIVDTDGDARVGARTTSTVKGITESVFRLLVAVSMAAVGGVAIYWVAGAGVDWPYPIGAAILGWLLLLKPAKQVYYDPGPATAATLFNRASYMPAGFLILVLISIYLPVITGLAW